ncbi:TonB-dependent siderophore receptor, partial [Acinetobacter baumannii]
NWTYYGDGNVFNRVAPPEWAYPDHAWESNAVTRNRRAASYASLRLRPVDRLALILGGRHTFDDITRINNRVKGAADTYRQDDKA